LPSFARYVLGTTKNIIIVFTSVGADAHIGPDRYGLTVGGQGDNRTVPLSPGLSPVEYVDSSGNVITDPATCDRGGYTHFLGYYQVGPN